VPINGDLTNIDAGLISLFSQAQKKMTANMNTPILSSQRPQRDSPRSQPGSKLIFCLNRRYFGPGWRPP